MIARSLDFFTFCKAKTGEETKEVGQGVRGWEAICLTLVVVWVNLEHVAAVPFCREEECQNTRQTRRRIRDPQGVRGGSPSREGRTRQKKAKRSGCNALYLIELV